ncbi:MAG: lysostaphin resistance A-like protein [Bacilli bacterium]
MCQKKSNVYYLSFIKQISCFVIGLVGLQLISVIVTSIVTFILLKQGHTAEEIEILFVGKEGMIVTTITYIVTLLAFVLTLLKDFKNIFSSSFKKISSYMAGIICLLIMIAITRFYSSIVSPFISKSSNSNQQAIVTYTRSMPLLAVIVFVFIGPICEELTYRLGLYSFIRRKGKLLAIILSSLVFAFIHFDFNALISGNIQNLVDELLIIPSYVLSGVCLSIVYEKYGLAASLTAHILNNLIAIIECF